VSALGERALAGVSLQELAADAVEQLRLTLPLERAELRAGEVVAYGGEPAGSPLRHELGPEAELATWFSRTIDDDEKSFVRVVASILGTALVRLRSEERMRHEALHDPLTGLANRTLLRDRLDHALARSARESIATGVLFVDLDDFKRVNDRFGHAAGDAALKAVAERLIANVRQSDVVGRMGGDEFAVILAQVDPGLAQSKAEALAQAVEAEPIEFGEWSAPLHLSFGVHEIAPDAEPEAIVAAADAAMYARRRQKI
jgi:diguanylate cyclase (GGDEF)-like protein